METKIDEIADGIYRLSTFVSEIAPPLSFRASIQGRHRLPSSSVRQRDASQTCRSVVNKRRTVLDRCCTRT